MMVEVGWIWLLAILGGIAVFIGVFIFPLLDRFGTTPEDRAAYRRHERENGSDGGFELGGFDCGGDGGGDGGGD